MQRPGQIKGMTLGALGRYDKAIKALEAIRIDSQLVEAHYNKGKALSGLGKHKEAIASFDNAKKAVNLQALGRSAEARDAVHSWLPVYPNLLKAREITGMKPGHGHRISFMFSFSMSISFSRLSWIFTAESAKGGS